MTSPATRPALRLHHATMDYRGGVRALDDVSLTVRRGELMGIVGPSGSGKSTLLHVMGTLERPTGGRVEIDGKDVAGLSDRRLSALRGHSLGFVFQRFHLIEGLSARENVATSLLYAGATGTKRRTLADEALVRVGLGHRGGHLPRQLSGGERQRVAIARAVVHDPVLVLADEPTGALDTANGRLIMDMLHTLHAEGTTIAVITHDRSIAAEMPRRVDIRDGRILSDTADDADDAGTADTDTAGALPTPSERSRRA